MALVVRFLLLRLVSAEPTHHLIPIHLVCIEFGPVHADELGFAAHRDSAPSAHPSSIDHDCIERSERLDSKRSRRFGTEFHHDGRSDRHDDIRGRIALAKLRKWLSDEGLPA